MSNYRGLISKLLIEMESQGILKQIAAQEHAPDEPKMFVYSGWLNSPSKKLSDGNTWTGSAGGFSFTSRELALLKCFVEAAERFCNVCYKNKDLITSSFNKLKHTALDPTVFTSNHDTKNVILRWIKAKDLLHGKVCLIPAQTVFFNYKFVANEPHLTELISTGAAGGFDFENTLLRGIYEIIERDAFMTVYLTKARIPRIDLSKVNDNKVKKILETVKRYRLEVEIFDLTNNLNIPSFLAILIDQTGLGPSISLGLKSSLNFKTAVVGSMEESFHTRPWMKKEVLSRQDNKFTFDLNRVNTLLDRGLFWTSPSMIKSLGFLLNQPKTKLKFDFERLSPKNELKRVLKLLKDHNIPAFYVDITMKNFKKLGYIALKAVLPTLQPLFLHESHRELRWERIKEVSSYFGQKKIAINSIPHPFL
ncbi:YcaO-like family protein [Candidatus Daviesbacteria bacterium]|nr:YcaO-like family protein [Candidatus Daviesbacteria bacterium]